MHKRITDYFSLQKIEFYGALSYSDCIEINKNIIEREDFKPESVILFLLPYYTGETDNISRYAASLDYHIAIREKANGLTEILKELYPENNFKAYGDHSPIAECNAAVKAGLGIYGDNGLLINEKYGSYVFIADIVTDIPADKLGCISPYEERGCLHCRACKNACPTGILKGEGTSCLSEITQRKGELSDSEIALMRKYNTAWGCDICQSVCPYNKNPRVTPIDFFFEERIMKLTTEIIDGMDKESFSKRAFAWRGRKTVRRNTELLKNLDK